MLADTKLISRICGLLDRPRWHSGTVNVTPPFVVVVVVVVALLCFVFSLYVFACRCSCVAPTFPFKWNKEALDLVSLVNQSYRQVYCYPPFGQPHSDSGI